MRTWNPGNVFDVRGRMVRTPEGECWVKLDASGWYLWQDSPEPRLIAERMDVWQVCALLNAWDVDREAVAS